MRDNLRHFPVNWINGMKINKDHFIAQDDGWKDALNDIASLNVSPVRYGVLSPSASGDETFNIKTTLDNQNTLRAAVLSCNAITSGGVRIVLPAKASGNPDTDGVPSTSFQFSPSAKEATWWMVLTVNPFERQPAGSPDIDDSPPRFPFVLPVYTVQIVSDSQFSQFANSPYALPVGKIMVTANEVKVDPNYIPPCFSVSAHPDLVSLYTELDHFLGDLETRCSQIVQKIFKKNQQNELSELVMFLCDRIMLYLGQSITGMRWTIIHESPVALFAIIVGLARVMKNTIDLRIGSGKEEMMNYLSEWCELKQGELESLFTTLANLRYNNNDINKNIEKIVSFVKVTSKLFETLSKLDFIGKKRESGIFVKEEQINSDTQAKGRRRFFG
ncbi:MAG: type VI secretion system baseplate subunit TssK [Pedobacter sp.]|nr:type VI secretion system baseplate subunit TssK [Pedobacter sp.]